MLFNIATISYLYTHFLCIMIQKRYHEPIKRKYSIPRKCRK